MSAAVVLGVLVLIAGCPRAKSSGEGMPPVEGQRPQNVATPQAASEDDNKPASAPEASAAKPLAQAGAPASKPADEGKAEGWEIPEGPLDDAKFVAISAKYVAAVQGMDESARSEENIRLVMMKVLKEANVTEQEYSDYADAAAKDPERAEKLAKLIEAAMKTVGRGETRGELTTAPPE